MNVDNKWIPFCIHLHSMRICTVTDSYFLIILCCFLRRSHGSAQHRLYLHYTQLRAHTHAHRWLRVEVGGAPQRLGNKSRAWFEKALLWLHSVFPRGLHSSQIGQKNFNGATNGLWLDRREGDRERQGERESNRERSPLCCDGGLEFHPEGAMGREITPFTYNFWGRTGE